MGTHDTLSPEQIANWRTALSLDMGSLAYALPEEAIIELRNKMNEHFNGPVGDAPVDPPRPIPEPKNEKRSWLPKLGDIMKKR